MALTLKIVLSILTRVENYSWNISLPFLYNNYNVTRRFLHETNTQNEILKSMNNKQTFRNLSEL